MAPRSDTQAPRDRTEPERTFVCPFCGTTFPSVRQSCSRCRGTPVVPTGESAVYEAVLPMCGPDYHVDRLDEGSTADARVGLYGRLSRSIPGLPRRVSPRSWSE